MARAVFPHEITDPDFQWLLNTYCETHPTALRLDTSCLPVVIILCDEKIPGSERIDSGEEMLALPPGGVAEPDSSSHKK